jgi:hypothetical protein
MPIRRTRELSPENISRLLDVLPVHVPSDSILEQLNIGLHAEHKIDDFGFSTGDNTEVSGFEFSTAISQPGAEGLRAVHRRYGFLLDEKPPEGFHAELDDYCVKLSGRLWTIDISRVEQPKLSSMSTSGVSSANPH